MHRSALELIAGDQAGKKRRKLKNLVHVHSWLLRFFFIFANRKISRIFSNDLPLSDFSNRDDYVSDQICIKNHKALTYKNKSILMSLLVVQSPQTNFRLFLRG